jgi:hypothetical protein
MDKLEQYVEQVCRRIGGPRSLRQHLREELHEHLREAAAEHQAAGMSEIEAIDRALTDFGGPDQVRRELEETHGHRLLPVVIDQAMQWKEITMRARWLWTTWAYVAAIGVILVDLLFMGFTKVYELPKLEKFYADGWIAANDLNGPSLHWMYTFLERIRNVWDQAIWWLPLAIAGWGVFEWRVRSENKPFMRLAGLGTAAVSLSVIMALTGLVMPLMFMVGLPQTFKLPQRVAAARLHEIDSVIVAMEESRAKKDWAGVEQNATRARSLIESLSYVAPAIMIPPSESRQDELRTQITLADANLGEAIAAGAARDAERLESAIQRFQRAYGSIRAAARGGEK